MTQELAHELERLGFSQKEAAVYLAALELGCAGAQDLSDRSGVNRATTYLMIETLTQRGLMGTFEKGKKRFFTAESPDRLLSLFKREEQHVQEKVQEAAQALPQLMALWNVEGVKPKIRYLEGEEGLKTVRELFEKQTGEFVQMVPFEAAQNSSLLERGREEHLQSLVRTGAAFRVLFVMDEPDATKLPSVPGGQMRVVSRAQCPVNGDIVVRQDTIYLCSYASTVSSVIITSRELARTVRALFELAWVGALVCHPEVLSQSKD